MESYRAYCNIDNIDGVYHMEGDVYWGDNKQVYAKYDGTNFINGLNYLLNDLSTQIVKELKTEPEPESETIEVTLEEQVNILTEMVNKLRDEKAALVDELNQTKAELNSKSMEQINLDSIFDRLVDFF